MGIKTVSNTTLWLAPLLALISGYLAYFNGIPRDASIALAVTVITALWWMTEAIPLGATSLIPIALLPFFGVLDAKTAVAQSYGNPLIILLLGGFLLSKGMEQSGVHRRLALGMVHLCGKGGSKQLILGFMLASAVLSMWISNTATALMLLPIALAVLDGTKDESGKISPLAAPLMLGIAYAASIGGMGSPIGTPPNLVFLQRYNAISENPMTFLGWMQIGVPIVIIMIPIMWLWISRGLPKNQIIKLPKNGPWRSEEVRTLIVFGITIFAWIFRKEPFGGWSHLFGLDENANDASVALIGALFLFCLPNGEGKDAAGNTRRLLNWKTANTIPWGILLLFSGGICLAAGIRESGLSDIIASHFNGINGLPVILIILSICLGMTFLTEVTSNTASTILMMPILASIAVSNQIEPALLMLPAALSASCAFMLPVATAPNAVVFGSGHLTVPRMAREGVVLNLIGVIVIGLYCWIVL